MYLLRDWMNFNEISGKNVTYDDIKSDKKAKLDTLFRPYFFKLILRINISFFQISNLSFYFNKNELKKNCKENHYVKGVMPDTYLFAQVHHICQNFGTHMWSCTAIAWSLLNPDFIDGLIYLCSSYCNNYNLFWSFFFW